MKGRWNHKLSVLDYNSVGGVNEAFKMIYDFYIPSDAVVLDLCCGKKLMYKGYEYPNVEFNDILPERDADYHYDCRAISSFLNKKYDWFIYDPPYVDIKGRNDKREEDYQYELMGSLKDFEEFTFWTKHQILNMMKASDDFYRTGVIAKITDFHWDGEIRGHHDLIDWMKPEFYLWDLRIYRFFRTGFNINWYKKKCFKTHSYFLIFKRA